MSNSSLPDLVSLAPLLLGNVVISKKFLRTRKIMVMHRNERGEYRCDAPRPMCQVSSSYSRLFPCHVLACHALHIMSSCAFHLHTCSSHASEHFPRCPSCNPALRSPPVDNSTFLSYVGVKHFRIGPILVMRPWFTTGRPRVKFRTIWTSFGTPTVNLGTEKA